MGAETVNVRNPGEIPVEVPGAGILPAGEEVRAPRSARLRRLVEGGALEVTGDGDPGAPAREPVEANPTPHKRLGPSKRQPLNPEPVPAPSSDYESQDREALEAEAERRGLEVEGSGANGNVLKADLVQALQADDAS